MIDLKYTNARGDTVTIGENEYFVLTHIDGQTSVGSTVSSSVVGGIDGDTVNNIQAVPRSIILDLRIMPNADVEEAKRYILRFFKAKQNGSLVWTQNGRTVTISGIVEAVDMPRWNNSVLMQITLHCSQPFWEDVENAIQAISEAIDLHYFTSDENDMLYFPEEGVPFGEYDTTRSKSFYNDGDVGVGMEITLLAIDTVTNPIIYDQDNNFFGAGYGEGEKKLVLEAGDTLTITTHKGNKSVKLNGVNIFDKIKPNSKWLQLEAGQNIFAVNSDDESLTNMYFTLVYKQRYI